MQSDFSSPTSSLQQHGTRPPYMQSPVCVSGPRAHLEIIIFCDNMHHRRDRTSVPIHRSDCAHSSFWTEKRWDYQGFAASRIHTSHSSLSMSCSSWLIWEPQWLSGSTLTPDPRNRTDNSHATWILISPTTHLSRAPTCGEHSRIGVSWGETHALLVAPAGAFGRPLNRQLLGLLGRPPACAALVVYSLCGAVQWRLKGLELGGGLPQQEARHKLTQHGWTLVLLNTEKKLASIKQPPTLRTHFCFINIRPSLSLNKIESINVQ